MAKRILFSLLCLLVPVLGMAQRISADEAADIAAKVLGKKVVKAEMKSPAKTPSHLDGENATPFYIIFTAEDGKGFVIVSTDRRAPQVIGYGDSKADPNNLPPQLKAILEKQDSILQATPNLPEHRSWRSKAPRRAGAEGGKLLKTANWGQGYPYNLLTPEIDGEHCPTGCVATAMAIIMKYHGWPEKGRGEHSYNWNGQDLSFDYANTNFDWAQMPEEYEDGNFTEAQAQEVSKLMKAAGNAVNMSYSSNESEAYNTSVSYNIYRYFRYDLPQSYSQAKNYDLPLISDDKLLQILKEEIDNDRPAYYCSRSITTNQGHAFVIDGYDIEDNLHINWGWNGTLNGYFALGEFMDYNISSGIIARIEPDKDSKDEYEHILITDGSGGADMNGGLFDSMNATYENLEKGVLYTLVNGGVLVDETVEDLKTFIALVDKNDVIKEVYPGNLIIEGKNDTFWSSYNIPLITGVTGPFCFNSEIEPTDKVQVYYTDKIHPVHTRLIAPKYLNSELPVVNNTPRYINIDWKLDETVNVELWANERSYNTADGDVLPNKVYQLLSISIIVSSDKGNPSIFINGENKTRTDILGINTSYGAYEDVCIEIKNILFSDMLDLDINVESEGSLSSLISDGNTPLIRSLKLTGKINYEDLLFIKQNLISLEKLDLTNTEYVPDNFIAESYVFADAGHIRNLLLPKNLKGIGNCTFGIIRALEQIYIPSSVEYIGIGAFESCQALKSVIVGNPIPVTLMDDPNDISTSTFFNTTSLQESGTLYVPKGSKAAYENADVWKEFPNIIEYEGEWHETLPGDVNADGEVNINDVVRLVAHILGENVEIDKAAADVNGDGEVNVNDVVKLTGDVLNK